MKIKNGSKVHFNDCHYGYQFLAAWDRLGKLRILRKSKKYKKFEKESK